MNFSIEKRLIVFSSFFVSLITNIPRLLALRQDGIMHQLWKFDLYEFLFQVLYNFLFCFIVSYYNIKQLNGISKKQKKVVPIIATNLFLLLTFSFIGIFLQKQLFHSNTPAFIFKGGYVIRLLLSLLLLIIIIEIFFLLEKNRLKDIEHEKLRNALLKTELELLKGQLNPHFFFNSLSSLSAIVREDPIKAQHYINHLSKAYRYSLQATESHLVSLSDELQTLESYTELLKMRYENAFSVKIDVEEKWLAAKLPHISLQPLIENAMKHNAASATNPLNIHLYVLEGSLICKNNLQPLAYQEKTTGTGLANLAERIRILLQQEIEIEKTSGSFIVKIPLVIN